MDIGSALAEVQVVEAGQLTEHDVAGPGNERIGGVVGPVVTIQHRVLGDLAAGAELGIRIRPDYAIIAVILVIALGGVVEVIRSHYNRVVDIGIGNAQPAHNIAVLGLPGGDIGLAAGADCGGGQRYPSWRQWSGTRTSPSPAQ